MKKLKSFFLSLALFLIIIIPFNVMTSYADNDTTNSTTEATVASTDDTTEEASTNEDTEQPEEPSTEETTEQPTDPGYEQDALNVLFIGNSFTKYDSYKYNVSDMFTNLSESQGKKVNVKAISYGSAYLSYYAFPTSKYANYYRELQIALLTEDWDYIILQEQSKGAVEKVDTYMIPAIEKLQSLINIYQPDAEILLFMTHGYYNGTTTSVNGESKLLSATQLQQYIQMSYTYIGNKLGLRVVPCGLAFARCQQLYPDMTILGTDNKHPNYLGYFLDAVCFYKAIFGKMPENTDIVPDGCKVTSEEMLKLYNAADGQLQLNTISHIMKIGDTYQLDAVLMDTTDANVTWKSLSSSIVSVSSTGLLTAKKAGSTLIIAQSESGLQDICYVTVEEEALYNAGIIFSTESHIVEQKDNLKITPAISTMLADDTITWSSSSKTIASVSSDGTVTANAPGKAVITATDKKAEKSASYTIYVRLTAPKKISIKTVATSSNKATEANVKISWSAVASAKSYVVYRSTSKNGEYTAIGTTTAKSYTDKKITTGKNYYYRVSAANTYSSCESSKSTVYARVIAPTTPTISKTSATTKKIKITWSRKTSATGYIIYRSTNNGKTYKEVARTTSNKVVSYTDKSVTKNKSYRYKIKAYRTLGGSVFYSNTSEAVKVKAAKKATKKSSTTTTQ